MEAVIFTGIQGSGKTTFYRQRFFDTHVRISLDLLRTRRRERIFVRTCLDTEQRFVVDNTNVLAAERAVYISAAKSVGFRVIGYVFQSKLRDVLGRNAQRSGKQKIPIAGVISTLKRMQQPVLEEGYDELFFVEIGKNNEFVVTPWREQQNGPASFSTPE
jgi:predicted kinase